MNPLLEIGSSDIGSFMEGVSKNGVANLKHALSEKGRIYVLDEAMTHMPESFSFSYLGPFKEEGALVALARECEQLLSPFAPEPPLTFNHAELVKYSVLQESPGHADYGIFTNFTLLFTLSGRAEFYTIRGEKRETMEVAPGDLVVMKPDEQHGVILLDVPRLLLGLRHSKKGINL